MKKSSGGGIHVKAHTRAGKKVRAYVRGAVGRSHPDGTYKIRSSKNVGARDLLNRNDSIFRETGKITGGISRARKILSMQKTLTPAYNADAPTKRQKVLNLGYGVKFPGYKKDKRK